MSKYTNRKRYKAISDYWQELYTVNVNTELGEITFCGLCANHGIIDTKYLTTPSGVPMGVQSHFCICPNGQARRYMEEKKNA